jgi:hypothetical protein
MNSVQLVGVVKSMDKDGDSMRVVLSIPSYNFDLKRTVNDDVTVTVEGRHATFMDKFGEVGRCFVISGELKNKNVVTANRVEFVPKENKKDKPASKPSNKIDNDNEFADEDTPFGV